MPIIILYFLFHNLNYTQIGILASVMAILGILTEVHGGVFADKYGKRLSLGLSAVFGLLTMFFYFLGNSFIYFLIASICYGASGAFISGTRNALMYDTLLEHNITRKFKKYIGRMIFISHLVSAVVLLLIPVVYSFNQKLPFLIGILFFTLAIITSLFFKEPSVHKEEKATNQNTNQFLRQAFQFLIKHKVLLSLILFGETLVAFIWVTDDYLQPLLTISGLEIIYFGLLYAGFRVLQGLGSEIAHRIEHLVSFKKLVIALHVLVGLMFFLYASLSGFWLFIPMLFIMFFVGTSKVIFDDEMNKCIASKWRTTILSISNLFQAILVAVFAFTFGIVTDFLGVQGMFWYLAGTYTVLMLVLHSIFSKHLPKEKIIN